MTFPSLLRARPYGGLITPQPIHIQDKSIIVLIVAIASIPSPCGLLPTLPLPIFVHLSSQSLLPRYPPFYSTLSLTHSLPPWSSTATTIKMSRITPPVHKLTHAVRSMSSTATRRSASALDHSRHTSQYLPRKLAELKAECSQRELNTNGSKSEVISPASHHQCYHY